MDLKNVCQDIADLFLAKWAGKGQPNVDAFQFDEEVEEQLELKPDQGLLDEAWRTLGKQYHAVENPMGVFQFPSEMLRKAEGLAKQVPEIVARVRDALRRERLIAN
jgi:hypothetical protein